MNVPTVRVDIKPPYASGGRKGFWKHVTDVDATQQDGFAFVGSFLSEGQHDLPIGAVLITKEPTGSVKSPSNDGNLFVVTKDGIGDYLCYHNWHTEFLTFRDAVSDALADSLSNKTLPTDCQNDPATTSPLPSQSDLSNISTADLIAEISRRCGATQ